MKAIIYLTLLIISIILMLCGINLGDSIDNQLIRIAHYTFVICLCTAFYLIALFGFYSSVIQLHEAPRNRQSRYIDKLPTK